MNERESIISLREQLHRHNYNYYVLNAPTISDKEFDEMMHRLQALEEKPITPASWLRAWSMRLCIIRMISDI